MPLLVNIALNELWSHFRTRRGSVSAEQSIEVLFLIFFVLKLRRGAPQASSGRPEIAVAVFYCLLALQQRFVALILTSERRRRERAVGFLIFFPKFKGGSCAQARRIRPKGRLSTSCCCRAKRVMVATVECLPGHQKSCTLKEAAQKYSDHAAVLGALRRGSVSFCCNNQSRCCF